MDSSQLLPLGEPSIYNEANQEESPTKPCFNRVDFLAKALMADVGVIAVAALGGYKDIIKMPLDSLTIATALFLILTFLSGYMLLLYVDYMSNCIILTYRQYTLHVVLVSFGGVCYMITNVLLLALVNWVNALLAWFLIVVLFIIGILGYAGSQINGTNHLPRDKAFEAAMKSCCDVAYLTVGCAFLMQVGVVFVYYKNPLLRNYQLPPLGNISFTFLALIVAEFSMMVTAMPLELLPHAVRSKLLFLVKFLKYFMLCLTAIAAMTLGVRFLDGLVLLALLPILVVIVLYQAKFILAGERINPDAENPEQVDQDPNNINEESEIPGMLIVVLITWIGVLSSVYPLYTEGQYNCNVYLRASIFILIGLIVASLILIAFPLNPSMNKQRAKVTKLVIGILMGLMITIAAAFLLRNMSIFMNKQRAKVQVV